MALKTYVLLPHTKPTAPIYQRINKDQRIRLDKRPVDHAYLKQTFTTPDGKNRTARLKLNANTIWQDEQMKPDVGIPANEAPTQQERDAVKFVYEILSTNNETVQNFLESVPQFDKWPGWNTTDPNNKGYAQNIRPLYTLLNKEVEAKLTNEDTKRRAKAVLKIMDIEDLDEIQNLMIKVNGSFFTPPDNVIDCQNALVQYIDDADDAMLDKLMSDEVSVDEKVTILIGKAIHEKVLSFEAIRNQVAKKKGKDWIPVKEISSSYNQEERKRYFAEFLTSSDGKLLLADLEKEVGANEKKTKSKKT